MDLQMNGKTALITGSSRGIGRGIALAFAKAGCTVALTGRDRAALDKVAAEVVAAGGTAHVFVADLLGEGAANALAQAVMQKCGRLDILVNNAGAVRRGDFFKTPEQEWHDGFGLKFYAHVWLSRALWPLLKQSSG
jgi:NAD(P)-dependent dehydrogenase (short-subunit alcohol dehydrogenase family)